MKEMGINWFSNRVVVDEWNLLSNHIVNVESMRKFVDEDERWNKVALLIQGHHVLAWQPLAASLILFFYVLVF